MIFSIDDLLEEMYEEFPDVDPKSISRICKKGLFMMKNLFISSRELIVHGPGPELKFFVPTTPDSQYSLTQFNIVKDNIKNGIRTKN